MTDDDENPTIAGTIAGAEEIQDPLDGLVEKVKADRGAALAPEVIERLAALKMEDLVAFERLRAQLKKAGCRMKALDEALAAESGDGGGGRGPSQAEILLQIAEEAELFHDPDGIAYADVNIEGHRETWAIRSKGFKHWLTYRYFEQTNGAANSEAKHATLGALESRARFAAPERDVHVRVGGIDGKIYLDLCDKTWRAVEIDADGWRVVDSPPVRFRRAAGMLPLPVPERGGSIAELRPFLNVRSDKEFVLAVAWCLAALRDLGPYPVLALFGEQGTAKSTFAELLRMLLDPNTMPTRAPPREDRDLFIAAVNGRILVFDNISDLAEWISDTLCRLATGGGFATRQLYTDQDEVLFNATRPTILNGIEDIVTRPDLADRAVCLTLLPIPDDKRLQRKELWAAFETARPRILGALLDAMSTGLKRLPTIKLGKLPRMADFAIWVTACETALQNQDGTSWEEGTFAKAYEGNIDEAVKSVLDASPIAVAVLAFMENRSEWSGNATDLLELLGKVMGDKATRAKTWPPDATRLGGKLRRSATFLRKVGIEIASERTARNRTITITCIPSSCVPKSGGISASSSVAATSANNGNDLTVTSMVTPSSISDTAAEHDVIASVEANTLKPNGKDAATLDDAAIPPLSAEQEKGYAPAVLSDARIRELAGEYLDAAVAQLEDTGDTNRAELEGRLREKLIAEGVLPAAVESEIGRIVDSLM